MFWDKEWRQAWRPAVALTAGTTVRGNRKPGAQKDAVTRNPLSYPLLNIPPVLSAQDILYPLSNNMRSIRFQSSFIRPSPGAGFFLSLSFNVKIWTLQKMEVDYFLSHFLNYSVLAQPA